VIDRTLWDRAHTQLKRNLTRSKAKGRVNILRGLLKCKCSATFVCAALKRGVHYYRCSNQLPSSEPDPRCRCKAMHLRADDVEDYVWGNCLWILHDPDFISRSGRKTIEEYTEKHGNVEVKRLRLNGELGINAVARNNVLELLRRGRLGLDDADAQLDILDKEASELRQAVEAADSVHECIQRFGVPSSGHYGSLVRQPGRGPDLTKFAGDLAPGIAGVFADVHLPEQAEGEDSVGLGRVRREAPDG
jgi:hypothetical protein